MFRSALLIGVTGFWITMTSQLIGRELFQLTPIRAAYEILPINYYDIREEYRGIYLGSQLIGFTHIALEVLHDDEKPKEDEEEPEQKTEDEKKEFLAQIQANTSSDYELRQNTYMTFLFLGEEREMLVKSKALLNSRLELQAFQLKFSSGSYWTSIEGQLAKNNLNIVIHGEGTDPVRRIIPVEQPLFFSESIHMLWTPENLRTGKSGRLQLWNPLLMNVENIHFRVGEKTKLIHQGQEIETFVIYLQDQGIETHYWATPEGVVIKNESPTGLIMQKQEAWRIFDALREGRNNLTDLPNLYSIPSEKTFSHPEKLKELKIKIATPQSEKDYHITKMNLDAFREYPWPIPKTKELEPYLASDEFIQSNDPIMIETSREVVRGETSALGASIKIMGWVHNWITPTPTVSIPSAMQVYKFRQGDCNEHTALFTALTRSLGIPTKMVAGIVYQKGRFFYHAWPEVFIHSHWIPLDPTFNQAPADVTHIPLIEGNLEEQINLITQLGKLNILSLEAR